MKTTPRVLVIGGGLAGLSGAFHMRELEPDLYEKESEVGGVCRSFHQDGFTFDVTGHLLHLKHDYTKDLIDRLLPDTLIPHDRRAAIYSNQVTTPYPFQANTYGLPPEVVRDCLMGFIESLGADHRNAENFHEWALETFGAGVARHFMHPFNEKFWKTDLREITADWVSWSIPKPTLKEVVDGALGIENKGMGYNPRFSYPRKGGIDCLPNALAKQLTSIHNQHQVSSIDLDRSVVCFTNGHEAAFEYLLTTIPLPVIFELIEDPPDHLLAAARKLRAISVLDFNVGIDRPNISDKHWVYYPEPEYVFTRVGFPGNFSDDAVPPGTSSMYIEITHPTGTTLNTEELYERAIADLHRCGILNPDDNVVTRHVVDIEYAYVLFDRHRQKYLPELIQYLSSNNILTCGRYGEWDYYSMEDSILSGKRAAEEIATRVRS
jgi:protoporphyrinogen oxidase